MITKTHVRRSNKKLAYHIRRWRGDALAFVIECCQAEKHGYPTHQQAEVLRLLPYHRYVAIKAGHGVGKTRLESWIHWWHMVCNKDLSQPLKCLLTGPTKQTVYNRLWGEVKLVKGHLLPWVGNQFVITEERVRYGGPTEFQPWESEHQTAAVDNTEALAGIHGTPLFVIEEPSGVDPKVFEALKGGMSDSDARSVMFGNPTRNTGYFYRAFTDHNSVWKCFTFSCRDCLSTKEYTYHYTDSKGKEHGITVPGRVTPMYIQEFETEHGADSNIVRYRVDGEFPKEAKDQLISRTDVQRAFARSVPETHTGATVIMGVDIADEGNDYSSFVVRRGQTCYDADRWHRPVPDTIEFLINKYYEYKGNGIQIDRINVEKNGVGTGVFTTLRMRLVDEPVIVAAVIPHKAAIIDGGVKCKSVRDYLWWQMRLWFRHKNAVFYDDRDIFQVLGEEIQRLHYDDMDGPLKVESKKRLASRGVGSPDVGDALAFTFYGDSAAVHHAEKNKTDDMHRKHRKKDLRRAQNSRSWVGV